jgi:hypothetical protein
MSKTRIPKKLRARVVERARGRCEYCLTQEEVIGADMDVDHVVPEALQGPTEEANLCLACSRCNEYKGNRIAGADPVTGDTVALFHPRRQSWADHFFWDAQGTIIAGLTPTGRATIQTLHLNRASLVRARSRWMEAGWHPPQDDEPTSIAQDAQANALPAPQPSPGKRQHKSP